MHHWSLHRILIVATVLVCAVSSVVYVAACPFCSAINLTFTENIKTNDIVVIAELLEIAKPIDDPDREIPKSLFKITDVIKGEEIVRPEMEVRSLLVGRYPLGTKFLIMGVDPPRVSWSSPMKASPRVVTYLKTLGSLPKSGAKRLAFFQNYFEDEESVLAFDAYDEFAQAPYEDVIALKDEMNREQLVKWILDPKTSTNRRRLYFTMLGVCGQESDIAMLTELIESGDRKKQAGLDALIACFLKLKGEHGLDLIVETFLKDEKVEYVDTLAAVSALRFHATELELIPRTKIVAAVRHLLDRPNIADMIIPDLARWEDWSVMERLVQMFKDADEDTSWLRVPIASYLRSCPKPEAKEYIAELQKIDPDAITRADFFLDFDSATEESTSTQENETTNQDGAVGEAADSGDDDTDPDAPVSVESYVSHRVPLNPEENLSSEGDPANRPLAVSVSKKDPVNDESTPDLPSGQLAAQTVPGIQAMATTPVAAVPTWQLILIPMACSVGIFVLLWSVMSGWFDRLIF